MSSTIIDLPSSCEECIVRNSCRDATRFLTQNCVKYLRDTQIARQFVSIQKLKVKKFKENIAGEQEQPGELYDNS